MMTATVETGQNLKLRSVQMVQFNSMFIKLTIKVM